jgi:ATP-dependent DNA helicase UvrD/PcrA
MARRFVVRSDADNGSGFTLPYLDELNNQQYEAVSAGAGSFLVVAGAGTGKTRTLIYRVAWLIESGVQPEEIVLLTFTRRAAAEMLSRASLLLDGRCSRVMGGTFHSFCLSILRRNAPQLGLPTNFTILDSSDAADVLDVLRGRFLTGKTRKRFPKKRTLQAIHSTIRNRDLALGKYLQDHYPQFAEYESVLGEMFESFQHYKSDHGLLDYDDLLHLTLLLFDRFPEIKENISSRIRHVLVDEFQDTNRAQAQLTLALASVHGNLMVVGDDAQSIYRFRGADFRNILEFPAEVPGTRLLKLEQNYRSTRGILDLANHIISTARFTFDKKLYSDLSGGTLPVFVNAPDARFESRFVAQMILDLREDGVDLSNMAVLFRNGSNSYDLEVELNRKKIPFVKYGGLKLGDAAHVKDVLAHFRVLENSSDIVSWNRILQLIEGIGPRTADRIIAWIDSAGEDRFEFDERQSSPRYIVALKNLFHTLRSMYESEKPIVSQLKELLLYYQPVLEHVYASDFPKRAQDLEQLVDLATGFEDRLALLSAMALDPVELSTIDVEPLDDDESPLVLSTIHSAKGLEFDVVFIIRALDGILPSAFSVGDEEALDEELRLLYVAVTRAARDLFISYPSTQYSRYDGRYFTTPSRFLVDVPKELLEPGTIVEEGSPVSDADTAFSGIAGRSQETDF